jgi:CubicO group peptidase (beta-lactamase class C family)
MWGSQPRIRPSRSPVTYVFGSGGSGGWADPEHDLALAMVCNRGRGTPIGDLRIVRLSQATARAVHSLH